MSQAWQRGELRAKQAAASSRSGTVGRSGRKIPATPSPIQPHPAMDNSHVNRNGAGAFPIPSSVFTTDDLRKSSFPFFTVESRYQCQVLISQEWFSGSEFISLAAKSFRSLLIFGSMTSRQYGWRGFNR